MVEGTGVKRRTFIAVGSNLGDRVKNCKEAIALVCDSPEVELRAVSCLYETAPVDIASNRWFVNGVFEVYSTLSPTELLELLLDVERKMGRDRSLGPDRVIDLDLLSMEGVRQEAEKEGDLELPHPRFSERPFVLVPWADIAPDYRVEGFEQTIGQLLENMPTDESAIKNIEES